MSFLTSRVAVLLAMIAVTSLAHRIFQMKVPNGDAVPNPCVGDFTAIWQGVGHLSSSGGGERNAFGKDFKEAGLVWNEQICTKDSDGDGLTNGEELGDPQCTWKEGDPPINMAISHPAICEPVCHVKCMIRNHGIPICAAACPIPLI